MAKESANVTFDKPVSGENRYARKRRLVHEFGSYCIAHLMDTKEVDLISLRLLVSEILQDWVNAEFKCTNPDCKYCAEFSDGRWNGSFKSSLGTEKEGMPK